jgi:hypothetical protein
MEVYSYQDLATRYEFWLGKIEGKAGKEPWQGNLLTVL